MEAARTLHQTFARLVSAWLSSSSLFYQVREQQFRELAISSKVRSASSTLVKLRSVGVSFLFFLLFTKELLSSIVVRWIRSRRYRGGLLRRFAEEWHRDAWRQLTCRKRRRPLAENRSVGSFKRVRRCGGGERRRSNVRSTGNNVKYVL